uniref:Bm10967, isoform b n=1 Tax=Brugia malayi TaxID=6279 RepID=A0A1U7F280_BRUMA|nr:Bm10967, isoform b [Brugia malayi]
MLTSSVKYRKCTYAAYCPLQGPQLFTENEMSKSPDVRYISDVDERLGVAVRLYAIVESSMQKIKAEMLVEHIRAKILPFDRSFGEHPINNVGNDAQLASLLGTILTSIERLSFQVCRKQKEEVPNIAIIIIRGRLILCGILGDIVFALLRKNSDSYASRVGSQQYTLFSNCNVPQTLKGSNFAATDNTLVKLYIHEMQPSDLRFFVFTRESIRMLLKSIPSLTLFTKSSDDIIWSLHLWQTEMYSKNPQKVPAAGFLLVDNLSKMIADSDVCLKQNFAENLLKKIKEEQSQEKQTRREQRWKMLESKLAAEMNISEKSEDSTNQRTVYLQTKLKQIQATYTRIKELVNKLLHEERNEMLAYMKRKEEVLNLEKECEQQKALQEKVLSLQERQRKQLADLRGFLRKFLKYQDIVRCELLINVEKLEQRLETMKFENSEIHLRNICRYHQRMLRVTLFQNKIEQNLESLEKQMQETTRNSCRMQRKLETLRSQLQQKKQLVKPIQEIRPISGQTYCRSGGAQRNFHVAANRQFHYGDEFQRHHWRRRSNSEVRSGSMGNVQ